MYDLETVHCFILVLLLMLLLNYWYTMLDNM